MPRRDTFSTVTREDSGYNRPAMNRRRARGTPLRKTNLGTKGGHSYGAPFFEFQRAPNASGPDSVSTMAAPSGGTHAAARIISRTRDAPSFVTTPGTVRPAIE